MKNSLFPTGDIPPLFQYEKLFEPLRIPYDIPTKRGRPPYSKLALLRALIYKNLRSLPTLSELSFELGNNPSMAEILGFNPLKSPPTKERFSQFLRTTPNDQLQEVRIFLIRRLLEADIVTVKSIALDSCPIKANIKENNLKTSVKNRFDKTRIPLGDPDARLGIINHFPGACKPKVTYFWGYRNHTITDTDSELPIWEKTLPANKQENKQAITLLKELISCLKIPVVNVIADANYDTEEVLSHIYHQMKAAPIIPRNPRVSKHEQFTVKKNKVLCQANLEMNKKGKMTSKGITYLQYNCPLHWSKKYSGLYLFCPADNSKYTDQKGCNFLLRLSPSVREKIDYGTQKFKTIYNHRTSAERVYSRLLAITMQNPTVIGLQSTMNHCTIAHVTVLLVALTAHNMGHKDKIRYVKSFLPKFAGKLFL